MTPIRTLTALLTAALLAFTFTARANDTPDAPGPLDNARSAIKAGNYAEAVTLLEKLDREKPGNADVLNLLGYSHRKSGNRDAAFDYYGKALAVDPKHRGANEYLGELYLETDQLAKAEERLAVLDDECTFGCEEYSDLKEAVAEYRKKKGL